MQNQIIYNLSIIADILAQIARLFWFIVPIVVAIWYFFYVLRIRKQIEKKQDYIFKVKQEIDDMLETVHKKRGPIQQSLLEAITEKNRIPLRANLETLKMERQFLLDKISILGLIKK